MTLTSVRARLATTADGNGGSGPGRLSQGADVLFLGVAFALLTGFVEASRIVVLRVLLHKFTWLPDDTVWMAPVANVYYFGIVALVAALIVSALSKRLPVWAATFPFALLSAFSLMTLYAHQRVSEWAIVILAVGVAAQITRLARGHWAGFRRLTRVATVALLLLTVGLFGGLTALQARERRLTAASPAQGAPNILLIILDTVRAASLSLYGYVRPTTPQLEQWAAKGVVFDNVYATSSWTLPSHSTMFTGRFPHEVGSDWERPLDDRFPTLAETLRGSGYQTAAFVANLKYTSNDSGLNRGFGEYRGFLRSWEQILRSSALGGRLRYNRYYPQPVRKNSREVNAQFEEWIAERRATDRPFFVFLNYFDAHLPYRASKTFRDKLKGPYRRVSEYDAAIATLDHDIDALLKRLEKQGVLENTLVIVTSDHGELLGEHGLTEHGNSLYKPVLQVPLVMWGPGVPTGLRLDAPVTLRDLPRTILELSGSAGDFPGNSLSHAWGEGDGSALLSEINKGIRTPPEWPVSSGGLVSLISDDFHYIRHEKGAEELFSLTADSAETRNLVTEAASQATLTRMRAQAARLVAGASAVASSR